MRNLVLLLPLAAAFAGASASVPSNASREVRVDTEKDEKRNTIIKLVNFGKRPILAEVEHRKKCSSVSTNQPPRVRTYLVNPGKAIQLRKVWSESNCEHDFRILTAAYHEKP